MKKRELEKKLKKLGCYFYEQGAKHECWVNSFGHKFTIPRHNEIQERLAQKIMKKDASFNPNSDGGKQ